jgi:hypothetical protein
MKDSSFGSQYEGEDEDQPCHLIEPDIILLSLLLNEYLSLSRDVQLVQSFCIYKDKSMDNPWPYMAMPILFVTSIEEIEQQQQQLRR